MTTVARARSSASSVEVDCVLVHMAVVPHLRGAGVGAALLTAFVAQARRRGVARVRLLTSAGDVGASSFYEHMGWSAEGQQVDIDGKSWARYEYRL
ncbi:MAG: GNAT family N-acetyltransferase [Acidimicrobiales bacterium]